MLNVLQNLDWSKLTDLLLSVIPVLICITVHECCHGLCALALGDPTAKNAGRLSLNPIKHFDLLGFIMMLLVGFGWAKPVPIDMRNFKNPKAGMALTALAGPASNMVLAALAFFIYGLLYRPLYATEVGGYALTMILLTARLSISLGVFNLIPISPLDGSKVLFSVIPDKWYFTLMRYERYGTIILYILVFFSILDTPLGIATGWVFNILSNFADFGFKLVGLFVS